MLLKIVFVISLTVHFVLQVNSAEILCISLIPSVSHQIAFQSIWKELSLRGHKVTVFAANAIKDPTLANLTEIEVGDGYTYMKESNFTTKINSDSTVFTRYLNTYDIIQNALEAQMNNPEIQKLLKQNAEYDLLLLGYFSSPLLLGFASKFKCPFVIMSPLSGSLHLHDSFGNPAHPVLNPEFLMPFPKAETIYQRFVSVYFSLWSRLAYSYYLLPKIDKIARGYFGKNMPYLGEIETNASLLLVNTNRFLHTIRPNVPAVVEMGQTNIKPKKPLPTDIRKILDEAKQGVVYFSLGSNVKSSNLGSEMREVIIGALEELPYIILWKWETDHLPNQPKNVVTRKWLPQQDILGHPNVKVFVTQGGLQSAEEAIFNGVPLVVMPFFGDQRANSKSMMDLGIALEVDSNFLTKEKLKKAIEDVAGDNKYREKIKEISAVIYDQPMTGIERSVWWVEHVIRTKGARYLRSPALDIPVYQYYFLDVIGISGSILVLLCVIMHKIFIALLSYPSNDGKSDNERNKKRKTT